ncbi:MAG: hypothetical protein ACI4W2_09310 [Eubacterium sp.]
MTEADAAVSTDKANGGQTDNVLHKPGSCLPAHKHEASLNVPNETTAAAIEEGS